MPVITKRRNYSVTSLLLLANMFKTIGKRFNDLGKEIDNVYIIGDWLASPFKFIGEWLLYGESKAKEANNYIKDLLEWIYTIIDGLGFNDLIDWSSLWFKWLRSDRRLFLQQLLSYYLIDGLLFLSSPQEWVKRRILQLAFWFVDFISNPTNFIYLRLLQRVFWLSDFFNNPLAKILLWLYSFNVDLRELLRNPFGFIINKMFFTYIFLRRFFNNPRQFIIDEIGFYSVFLYRLIFDRERFIFELIAKGLGLPLSLSTNPLGILLDYLLLKLDTVLDLYLERIKSIFIKIILKII